MLDPATWDHDACGVGLIADRHARAEPRVAVARPRGADAGSRTAAPPATATAPPTAPVCSRPSHGHGLKPVLPPAFIDGGAARAAGTCFLPATASEAARTIVAEALEEEGWGQLVWREVPIDASVLATAERASRPHIQQVFALHQSSPLWTPARQERSLYRARVSAETRLAAAGLHDAAIVSLSTRTMVYKALVAPADLDRFYPGSRRPALRDDLHRFPPAVQHQHVSAVGAGAAIPVAGAQRRDQYDSRQPPERAATPGGSGGDARHARRQSGPLVRLNGSDSQSLDDMVEHLRQGGLSLAHAFARVLPRAWEHDPALSARERAFEAYQSTTCEPWEGPAAIAFADGRQVGAVLDRNGFRPARVLTSKDGLVCVGSESGIFDIPERSVERRGRLGPGEMLVVDLESGRLIDNTGLRRALAAEHPYRDWVQVAISEVSDDHRDHHRADRRAPLKACPTLLHQRLFGYTSEEIELIVRPMVEDGKEAIGSMGDDTPARGAELAAAVAARLLPAAIRAGDQPADRFAARTVGDVAAHGVRPARPPARRDGARCAHGDVRIADPDARPARRPARATANVRR